MQASDMSIELPRNFNAGTMYPPIMRALNSLETSGLEALDIDFKGLKFIGSSSFRVELDSENPS